MSNLSIQEIVDDILLVPEHDELDSAPMLLKWRIFNFDNYVVPHCRLDGSVENHPKIHDPFVTTSPLLELDIGAGLARTCSRWYLISSDIISTEDEISAAIRIIRKHRYDVAKHYMSIDKITNALLPRHQG